MSARRRLTRRLGVRSRSSRQPSAFLALAAAPLGLAFGMGVAGSPGAMAGMGAGLVVGGLCRAQARRSDLLPVPAPTVEVLMALDLMAAALAAGALPVPAARVVGECLPGRVGMAFSEVGARERAGADPWSALMDLSHPMTDRLCDAARRSGATGAPLEPWIRAMSDHEHQQSAPRAEAVARTAGSWAVLPLGLCFLPAYLAIGVVPSLIGLSRRLP